MGRMSDQALHLVLGAILLVHGIAHVGPIGAMWWVATGHHTPAGTWSAAHSWALPMLASRTATTVAATFWVVSIVGFTLAALAFWGIGLSSDLWPPLGAASALVSGTGIVLFFGSWPAFNAIAALVVNVGVLVAVAIGWPPDAVLAA